MFLSCLNEINGGCKKILPDSTYLVVIVAIVVCLRYLLFIYLFIQLCQIKMFERYLKKCCYSESVITGQNFARTRDALKSKQKHLKRLGKEGNKPNEASSLTPEERDILFERKEMGFSSPKALINTLWLNNCMHFGLRGGKEQRELKWGDMVLKTNPFGKEYLEYCP